MAGIYAVAAVSETLRGLLVDARPKPEFDAATIEIFQASDYQKPKPLEEGVSIFLYRVTVSAQQRGIAVRVDGTQRASALPIDLSYVLTVWGRTAIKQQRLLGWMMRLLEDKSNIEASVLNHYGSPERSFAEDETVTLVHDPLALADLSNLWDLLKPNAQLSVGYLARMVYLESTQAEVDHTPVQTRVYELTQVKR